MSIQKLYLNYVTLSHVNGKAFEPDEEQEKECGLRAKFGIKIDSSKFNEESGYELKVFESIETRVGDSKEKTFSIEIVGHYSSNEPEIVKAWIETPEAAYTLATSLFPYLRNLARPLLEHLGAADVDFPWNPPHDLIKIQDALEDSRTKKPRKRNLQKAKTE
jgi:hypothetical protein